MAGLIRHYLYVGIKGQLVAVDVATGAERWRTKLKGSEFVSVTSDGTRLYAAARGELFCLDGATGTVLWRNPLSGLGWGLASLLPGAAPRAADQTAAAAAALSAAQRRHAAS